MTTTYCKCPFCSRTFNIEEEVSTKIVIDGIYRWACSPCSRKYGLSDRPVDFAPPDGKPNGGLIHRAPAT